MTQPNAPKPSRVFADRFLKIVNTLDVKFRAMTATDPNNADRGELCELFIKGALEEILEGNLTVFRGGKVVDSSGNRSSQMDIIIAFKSALRIFADKGLYPVESVVSTICITSTLTRKKLAEDIKVLASIPVNNPKFLPMMPELVREPGIRDFVLSQWKEQCPYRVIVAFRGDPDPTWFKTLNEPVDSGAVPLEHMPELIIINRKGMYMRKLKKFRISSMDLKMIDGPNDHFAWVPFVTEDTHYHALTVLLSAINPLSLWQMHVYPNYGAYFYADMGGDAESAYNGAWAHLPHS